MHDSSFGRLIGVLVSPGKTFQSIAERPTWVLPMVVLALLLTGTSFLAMQRIDMMAAVRQQMEAQGQQVPPNMEKMRSVMVGCQTAGILLGTVALCFAGAGLFMLFNLLDGRLRYFASLGVITHALMPMAVSCLLLIPVVLSRSSISLEELRSGSLLPSNLTVLAPEDAGLRLVTLLSSFDFFSLWILVLLTIGYAIAARISKTKAGVTVVAIWVLVVLARVGLAGLAPMGGAR
jgi:hypothetical protein